MNTQIEEVHEEIVRMQKGFRAALESQKVSAEEKSRLWTKLGLLDELLRFVDSRPEIEPPKGAILKDTLVKCLEATIEHQQRIVLIYVQDKCFEGGKLAAYKEILEDVKKM